MDEENQIPFTGYTVYHNISCHANYFKQVFFTGLFHEHAFFMLFVIQVNSQDIYYMVVNDSEAIFSVRTASGFYLSQFSGAKLTVGLGILLISDIILMPNLQRQSDEYGFRIILMHFFTRAVLWYVDTLWHHYFCRVMKLKGFTVE